MNGRMHSKTSLLMLTLLLMAAAWWVGGLSAQDAPTPAPPRSELRFRGDGTPAAASPAQPPAPPGTRLRFAEAAQPEGTHLAAALQDGQAETYPRPRVDPIAANGPIFVDWPQPDLVLLFSGAQDGYLEPCGCAGLDNMKGGLMRRHTLIKELEAKGWPVVPLDAGGQVRRFGKQAEIKFRHALDSLAQIGYGGVGFGPRDLQIDLLSVVLNLDETKNPLVAANVGILDFDSGFTRRYRIVEKGGLKIGVTSVLGKAHVERLRTLEDVKLEDPEQALAAVLPDLVAAQCDHLVLLVHGHEAEAEALARRFGQFDWVAVAEGADEPRSTPRPVEGQDSHLVEVGHKAMYVVAVGLYKDGPVPFRYQRVPLDHRFADSPEMHATMVAYQKELELLGLEGLGVKPLGHPSQREFAGSARCADCHLNATLKYEATPHFHATETLVKLNPPRQFDPECLSCHATGWEPQKYFPFTSGFLGLAQTPHLVGNGCENCHGPAARHAAAEYGDISVSDQEREDLRAALRYSIVDNEGNREGQVFERTVKMCMQCHDLDNSPDFDFQVFWEKVKHAGKD